MSDIALARAKLENFELKICLFVQLAVLSVRKCKYCIVPSSMGYDFYAMTCCFYAMKGRSCGSGRDYKLMKLHRLKMNAESTATMLKSVQHSADTAKFLLHMAILSDF